MGGLGLPRVVGIYEGTVPIFLNALPVVKGLPEFLQYWEDLLPTYTEILHGVQGLPGPFLVCAAHVGVDDRDLKKQEHEFYQDYIYENKIVRQVERKRGIRQR